jgi:hypothetical protein
LHIIIDPDPHPRHPLAKSGSGGGGSTSDKGKQSEALTPELLGNGNGEGREQRYERGLLPSGRQLSGRPSAEHHEPESAVQDRPRNVQKNKNKNRVASPNDVGPLPQAPPAPADRLSYDHAEGDYFPSYFEAGHSGASDIAYEGGRSLSPPQAIVNHYPSKESYMALMALALGDARNKAAYDNVAH